MNCAFCQKETDKTIKCQLIGEICSKCCFNISVATPEYILRIRKEKKLKKEEVLKECEDCSAKFVLLRKYVFPKF